MTRKLVIVSILALLLSIVAGAVSPSVERWWAERGIPPGQKVAKRLSDYYQAELFDRVLTQAKEERDREENAEYRPQILYIEWVASRRTDQMEQASAIKAEFVEVYPDHILAADMHFSDAMTLLASSEYTQASEKLAMIEAKWPDAKVTMRAKEIRAKLENRKEDQPQRHRDTEVAPRRVPD